MSLERVAAPQVQDVTLTRLLKKLIGRRKPLASRAVVDRKPRDPVRDGERIEGAEQAQVSEAPAVSM